MFTLGVKYKVSDSVFWKMISQLNPIPHLQSPLWKCEESEDNAWPRIPQFTAYHQQQKPSGSGPCHRLCQWSGFCYCLLAQDSPKGDLLMLKRGSSAAALSCRKRTRSVVRVPGSALPAKQWCRVSASHLLHAYLAGGSQSTWRFGAGQQVYVCAAWAMGLAVNKAGRDLASQLRFGNFAPESLDVAHLGWKCGGQGLCW